ncbi:hypothetical protein X736_10755 [Mesorhizobium sp. L2C089B000]|nr:hypothetical protein X736_10755 [Mesorhizobium sp. L2C089B000]
MAEDDTAETVRDVLNVAMEAASTDLGQVKCVDLLADYLL